jgi:hypothetical protein
MPFDWFSISLIERIIKILSSLWPWLKQRLHGPRLRIYFDAPRTYKKEIIKDTGQQGCFCHLVVHNSGKETAQDCEVWLERVGVITQEGEIYEKDFVTSRQLQWAYEKEVISLMR